MQKIPRPNDILVGALLKLCIVPAYLLVHDLVALKPGQWIILNAGNGVIAQFVVQFARRVGVRVVSVVRDRKEREIERGEKDEEEKEEERERDVKEALKAAGAEVVLTETELERERKIVSATVTAAEKSSLLLEGREIVLALDSVFGKSGQMLMKSLAVGGTYVQMGVLGGPQGKIEVGFADLFARRITMRGFRGSALWAQRSPKEQSDLLAWLVGLFNKGELVLPGRGVKKVVWKADDEEEGGKEVLKAVEKAQKGGLGQRKVVMVFE